MSLSADLNLPGTLPAQPLACLPIDWLHNMAV